MSFWRSRSRVIGLCCVLALPLTGCDDSQYQGSVTSPPSSGNPSPPDNGNPNPPTGTPTDNAAVVTRSTSGTITTASGGTRTLSLSFNASDTRSLTNLVVSTDLGRLPPGWSAPENFNCASVSAGSGCVLNLTYSPTSAASGSFDIDYSYTNDAGTAKSGRETIAYLATAHNNVVATGSPAGQVIALVGGGNQPVAVTFTTDDGWSASQLQLTTALDSLPSGWSASSNDFRCETVGTGNGCQLNLTYAPTAVVRGALTLGYEYLDNSGTSKVGSINIAYAGTVHNNVVGTFTPSGQVAAVIGSGRQNVTVTFTSDDANSADAFAVTTDLSSLPSGWRSPVNALTCSEVSTGNACELPLEFAPTTVGSGTLALAYSYRDNAGETKTGSVNIPYVSTSNNNVITRGYRTSIALRTGEAETVTVTFATDDMNPASELVITSGLDPLPTHWSSNTADFQCASVTGLECQLTLTYTPLAAETGTLALGFAYIDNSGNRKTGTVSVDYTASPYVLYVSHYDRSYVSKCTLRADGGAQSCETTGAAMQMTSDIASQSNWLFSSVASGNPNGSHLSVSELDHAGNIRYVDYPPASGMNFMSIAVYPDGSFLYAHDTSTGFMMCTLYGFNYDCYAVPYVAEFTKVVFSRRSWWANGAEYRLAYGSYLNTTSNTWTTQICQVRSQDGSFWYCEDTGTNTQNATMALQIVGDRLYLLSSAGGIVVCPIESSSRLGACRNTAESESAMRAAFTSKFAYLTTVDSYLKRCPILSDGTLGACMVMTDPSFGITLGIHVK